MSPSQNEPLCNCRECGDCPFGNTGRRFELCRGTDQHSPQQRRQAYRDLMIAKPEPVPTAAEMRQMTRPERDEWRLKQRG